MSGKFQPANSEYNKDATFAKFNVDGSCKVTVSEAIAKDSDDNYITVYAKVEYPLVGVESYGNMGWIYEPTLCKFQIPKKSYSNEYKGKKTEIVQTAGMKAAVHLITEHGFDKPFSGLFDFTVADAVAETIITGKNPDGRDTNDAEKAMLATYFMSLKPLDKLTELEGKEIKEYSKGGGGYGGSKGQTEADKLKDRLAFIKAQMIPDSEVGVILASIHGEHALIKKVAVIDSLLSGLFN